MADDSMPTSYETKTTTTSSSSPAIGFHPEYLKTIPGILKIVEVVLSLIVFICACSGSWGGSGWVQFVSISAFISSLIVLILHLLNLISRIPGPWLLIEFIYYIVFTIFFLIAAIVAAAAAGKWASSAAGAAAFFGFAATAVYGVDTFLQFRAWRSGSTETSATTTTTTTVESGRTTTY